MTTVGIEFFPGAADVWNNNPVGLRGERVGQDLSRMILWNYFWISCRDLALLVYQVADAGGIARFWIGAGAISHSDLAVGVT